MAGRFKRVTRLAFFVALFLATTIVPSLAEAVRGESRDLAIRFVVQGGLHWCGSHIKVLLTASSANSFQPDAIPFLQMIGRIRAVVLSQCPAIETIAFDGIVKGRTVFAAETSRLTRWRRFISLELATHRPICVTTDDSNCLAKIDAYLLAHSLMRGDAFAETELTSVLQADSQDLEFRSKDVIGKLRMTSRAELSPEFPTPGQLADAIIANISDSCTKQGGVAEPTQGADYAPKLAERKMTCRGVNGSVSQNAVLVLASPEQFRVFSLWAEDPNRAQASNFADRLVKAINSGR